MMVASGYMEKTRVLFLDQREIIGLSICSLFKDDLKIEMITGSDSITNWPEIIEKYQPKIVLIDVGYHGTAIVKKIKQRCEKQIILAITGDPTYKEFLDVFQLGVKAYLLIEDLTVDSLRAAIEFAMKEVVVLSCSFADIICKYLAPKDIHIHDPIIMMNKERSQSTRLSTQEKEILALILTGASNREIAKCLHIAENTTKVHLRNIMGKLGVNGKQKLASFIRAHHHLRNELLIEYDNLKDQTTKIS
jgi:DNA-binding NarL/FixJ family response regulator